MTDRILEAFLLIATKEGEWWYHLPVDVPEWTSPRYFHQN